MKPYSVFLHPDRWADIKAESEHQKWLEMVERVTVCRRLKDTGENPVKYGSTRGGKP